jgi:hypothetical protein
MKTVIFYSRHYRLQESGFLVIRIVQNAPVGGMLVTKEREVDQY